MIGRVGEEAPNGAVVDDAILYAAENGARIVQMSFSVGQTEAINAAIALAHEVHKLTLISSSGNDDDPVVDYPSSNPHVIAVGATDLSDRRANFSNYGLYIEISAPGVGILLPNLDNTYGTVSGTSFSAPLVSGVVALMLRVNPYLVDSMIRQILRDSAEKVGGYDYNWHAGLPGHSFELGYGRLNAAAAVAAAIAADSSLFVDGFDSGDTSAWSSVSP